MVSIEGVIIQDTMWNQMNDKVSDKTRITKLEKANEECVVLLS